MGTALTSPAKMRIRWRASGSASTSYSENSHLRHSSHSRISSVNGQVDVPYNSSFATGQHLQHVANNVINRRLHFLDSWNVIAVHNQREIGQPTTQNFSTVVPEQS